MRALRPASPITEVEASQEAASAYLQNTLLRKLRAVALQKRFLTDACAFVRRNHAHVLVGSKQGDMSKVGGEKRESLIRDDALLFLVPMSHLLPSHIGFLLHLFHRFWHRTLLCCFCFTKRTILFLVHGLHSTPASTTSSTY